MLIFFGTDLVDTSERIFTKLEQIFGIPQIGCVGDKTYGATMPEAWRSDDICSYGTSDEHGGDRENFFSVSVGRNVAEADRS